MEEEEEQVVIPGDANDRGTGETGGGLESGDQEEGEDHTLTPEVSLRQRTGGDRRSSTDGDGRRTWKDHVLTEPPQNVGKDEGRWMQELAGMVRAEWKRSGWWQRHGIDWSILGLAMGSLPAGFLCLGSQNPILSALGFLMLGLAHAVITVKGSHMASHRTLCQSPNLARLWAVFFLEVCSSLPVPCGEDGHVKLHHGHTNVIGLGDSSVWKSPALNRGVYMFLAPLALPVLTLLVGLSYMKQMPYNRALRSLCCISLGLGCHLLLLVQVSGFSLGSALGCMFLSRALLAIPFIHVNIFQHIGLPMFSPSHRPRRLWLLSHGVLNLPRNLLLDWTFGHSLISCHVEHHLFPQLSDNMCLKVKPVVSTFLRERRLPYLEDTYMSRLRLFLQRYDELMVQAPPITELVELH